MPKDQSHFYEQKKPWSKVKDDLLGYYLTAYFQKILTTRKLVYYVDGFAGRGAFLDGTPGSPLIALRTAKACLRRTHAPSRGILMTFIEANLAADLERIVAQDMKAHSFPIAATVVPGRFELETPQRLTSMAGGNVFLYIDPFGIKDLDFGLITSFGSPTLGLHTVEVLMNLNSFGFIRAACRAMKVKYEGDSTLVAPDDEFVDELEESATPPSVELLDAIAGGTYWRPIVDDMKHHGLSGQDAELRFSNLYRDKLRETYRYVLSMPIRVAPGQPPKYRMVHATNHPHGCVWMADDMIKRKDDLYIYLPRHAQPMLLDTDIEGDATDADIDKLASPVVDKLSGYTDVETFIADFYSSVGVVCSSGAVRRSLKQAEAEGRIEVQRSPDRTPEGRPTAFFTTTKDQRVAIRPSGVGRDEHAS